jgi:hypothetical protein
MKRKGIKRRRHFRVHSMRSTMMTTQTCQSVCWYYGGSRNFASSWLPIIPTPNRRSLFWAWAAYLKKTPNHCKTFLGPMVRTNWTYISGFYICTARIERVWSSCSICSENRLHVFSLESRRKNNMGRKQPWERCFNVSLQSTLCIINVYRWIRVHMSYINVAPLRYIFH